MSENYHSKEEKSFQRLTMKYLSSIKHVGAEVRYGRMMFGQYNVNLEFLFWSVTMGSRHGSNCIIFLPHLDHGTISAL